MYGRRCSQVLIDRRGRAGEGQVPDRPDDLDDRAEDEHLGGLRGVDELGEEGEEGIIILGLPGRRVRPLRAATLSLFVAFLSGRATVCGRRLKRHGAA
jgi:hypothetical protein